MTRPHFLRRAATMAALAVVYFAVAKLGLRLAFLNPSATPVWPPTGMALAALLVLGYRVWPAILVGAFCANLFTAGTVATSIGIAVGNTLEGVVGAYLVNRFANGRKAFERAQDVVMFAALAGLVSTTVSATVGVTSLALGGFAAWARYGSIWVTWWLGDAGGALVVAPLLILWSESEVRWEWRGARSIEAIALLLGLFGVGEAIFGGLLPSVVKNYPLEFLCIPFLIWLAFRFGGRAAATAIALLNGITIPGTLRGFGPFVTPSRNESLLLLQAFMSVTTVMTLLLAAVVSERRRSEEMLRHMAISDSVTGLANPRRFLEVMDQEIKRSQRTQRPFTVLLFDLDGLKEINDRYGHPVGTRALVRLAEVLRTGCREIDTAARLGGDEFVVVLLEPGGDTTWRVVQRILDRLAESREEPRLSVSVGVAVYPHDGQTVETLLKVADTSLYEMKRRAGSSRGGAQLRRGSPRHPRVRVRLTTEVESLSNGAVSQGHTENISVGGLRVLSPETFAPKTDVIVRLKLPGAGTVESRGMVLTTQRGVGMEIQFQQMKDADREIIAELVRRGPAPRRLDFERSQPGRSPRNGAVGRGSSRT